MIKYDLKCKNGHEFEGWFSNSSDYDAQRKKRLVDCPYCETSNVEKAQGLLEEGVSIAPLPEALLPAAKKTLN